MRLYTGCMTCTGNVREENQDTVVLKVKEKKGKYFLVLAVCDGIGGLEHGETAAKLAADRIGEWFEMTERWIDFSRTDGEVLYAHLKDVAEECNTLIRRYQAEYKIRTGSTLSLLMIYKEKYYIVQVGDSRIYCYHDRELEQLTQDASVTKITNGVFKSYLNNYLGKSDELWFTEKQGSLRQGDILLVCTDGFYHHLTTADIAAVQSSTGREKTLNAVCGTLIERMLLRGETDNITLGLVKVRGMRG